MPHYLVLLFSVFALASCGPQTNRTQLKAYDDSYYPGALGLNGSALKDRLHTLIKTNIRLTYNQVLNYLVHTDADPVRDGYVLMVYSKKSVRQDSEGGWNREHVWAKARGFPRTDMPAFTDLQHIRPCEIEVNSSRSSMDFGEVTEGRGIPGAPGILFNSKAQVFEPADELKGDIARIMFYMDVRYQGDVPKEPDLRLVENLPSDTRNGVDKLGNGYFANLSTLIRWHKEDPVDDAERRRHEKVYHIQKNRNPFIDNPEWVENVF
jgi:endonuclease I